MGDSWRSYNPRMFTLRRAAFVAVGSEMLRADRVDTNSLLVSRLLQRCGYALVEKRCVEDEAGAIARAVRELAARTDLVVVSGGLGPTADDVTREGVAQALGVGLLRHDALVKALEARYRRAGRTIPEIALRMADVVEGAEILPNPQGTAPGQLVTLDAAALVLLPGVPRELEEIFTTHLLPRWGCGAAMKVRTLRLSGVYESQVEERVSPLYDRFGREAVTILAGRGVVDLVLMARGDHADAHLAEMDEAFSAVAGDDLFGRDEVTLPAAILALCRERGWRLATAESCTGGLVAAQLTSVAGSSDVFVGSVVAYANELKEQRLGVPRRLLEEHGAVSQETAEAMARGALGLGAEVGLAITGIAGPGGGSEDKPVGTVHVAAFTPVTTRHRRFRFPGDRAFVRECATNYALDLLRRTLQET